MGKKREKVKFRIIPEKLLKELVEFIDEIQFDAAKLNTVENHHLINLCNYLISCLINSDSFIEDYGEDKTDNEDYQYWTSDSTEFYQYDMSDMSDEEYKRLLKSFDSFMRGFNKEKKRTQPKTTLKKFASELKRDVDLTTSEKFELYYDEYCKRKNESKSFEEVLDELGITRPKKK